MKIKAALKSGFNANEVTVATSSHAKTLVIPPKVDGKGSSINGGELLCLSLAVCYCNDIYREASKRNIHIDGIEVEVSCEFGAEGEAGSNFKYRPIVQSTAAADVIEELIRHTDTVAEIHNTLRQGVRITLE